MRKALRGDANTARWL